MKMILHRFGLVCFWFSLLVTVLAVAYIIVLILSPGYNAVEVGVFSAVVAVASIAIGSAIRFIFGWRGPDQ